MAKILVTGGAGFMGSHIVDGLVAKGHDVLVVDNLYTGSPSNLSAEAQFADVDIAGDAFVALAKTFNPDVISHLAAQASVPVSMNDPVLDAKVNILGGLNVCRAAVEVRCEQVLYINTGGALYGEPDYLPCDEQHPIRPISGYALSKWTSECYFRMLLPDSIPLKVLRYANVYGPRQSPHGESGVVAIFARKMLEGKTVRIFGDGEYTRDYVYTDDFVEAHDTAMNYDKSIVVNFGTGQGTSVNQVFQHLKALTGYDASPIYGDPRPGDVRHIVLDASRARNILGWKPKVDLLEGLKRTVSYMRQTWD